MYDEIRRLFFGSSGAGEGIVRREAHNSELISKLAHELSYHPPTRKGFPSDLKRVVERAEAERAAAEQELKGRWQVFERHNELTAMADDLKREVEAFTPFSDVGLVADALRRLEACLYLLSLYPDGPPEKPDEQASGFVSPDETPDRGVEGETKKLRAWKAILWAELPRLEKEINAGGHLYNDVCAVFVALQDAEENLKLAENLRLAVIGGQVTKLDLPANHVWLNVYSGRR
jgi:hypothetical protein